MIKTIKAFWPHKCYTWQKVIAKKVILIVVSRLKDLATVNIYDCDFNYERELRFETLPIKIYKIDTMFSPPAFSSTPRLKLNFSPAIRKASEITSDKMVSR